MVELWIRPCKYVENKEKLFPLLLAKFSPPVADALEECQILAMELSLHSKDYYFDIEILQQRGVSQWYRFWNGDKKVMRNYEGDLEK